MSWSDADARWVDAFEAWRVEHEAELLDEFRRELPQYFTPIRFEAYLRDAFDEWRLEWKR